jgi:regulator of replication initiation timing
MSKEGAGGAGAGANNPEAALTAALQLELSKERDKTASLMQEVGRLRIELFAQKPNAADDVANLKRQVASMSAKLTKLRAELEDREDEQEVLREEVHTLRQRLAQQEVTMDVNDQLLELETQIEQMETHHRERYDKLRKVRRFYGRVAVVLFPDFFCVEILEVVQEVQRAGSGRGVALITCIHLGFRGSGTPAQPDCTASQSSRGR